MDCNQLTDFSLVARYCTNLEIIDLQLYNPHCYDSIGGITEKQLLELLKTVRNLKSLYLSESDKLSTELRASLESNYGSIIKLFR